MTNLQYLHHAVEHCLSMIAICRKGNFPNAQVGWETLLANFEDELARERMKTEEYTEAEIERSQRLIAHIFDFEHEG